MAGLSHAAMVALGGSDADCSVRLVLLDSQLTLVLDVGLDVAGVSELGFILAIVGEGRDVSIHCF